MNNGFKVTLASSLLALAASSYCNKENPAQKQGPPPVLPLEARLIQQSCNPGTQWETTIYGYSFPYQSPNGSGSYGLINGELQFYVGKEVSSTRWISLEDKITFDKDPWLTRLKGELTELKNNKKFVSEGELYGPND